MVFFFANETLQWGTVWCEAFRKFILDTFTFVGFIAHVPQNSGINIKSKIEMNMRLWD